jgi:hypothetical protein
MAQNWNNIVSYIKVNLGVPYNLLELSDDDIINYLKEHSLPKFSQYIPCPIWITLSSNDIVSNEITKSLYTYQLPDIMDDYDIVGIQDVFYNTASGIMNSDLQTAFMNPLDTVLSNSFYNLNEDLQPVHAFQFIPPKTITFAKQIMPAYDHGVVVEINTVHKTLDTIPADVYQKIFKDNCLLDVINWVINIRSKFVNISTPFNTLNLNIDRLQTVASNLETKIQDYIANLPPKHVCAWL